MRRVMMVMVMEERKQRDGEEVEVGEEGAVVTLSFQDLSFVQAWTSCRKLKKPSPSSAFHLTTQTPATPPTRIFLDSLLNQ